jgi:N-acetylmuramoyl-L-alanine amidase
MTLAIENHCLQGDLNGIDVVQDPCDGKNSGHFTGDRPDMVVIHYTAGPSLSSAVNTLKNPQVKASAHLVIDRDGSTSQLIGFDHIAWHAGKSRWQDRTGINNFSIGIELVNAGELNRSGSQFISWFGKRYNEEEVVVALRPNQSTESYWHAYTQEQIETCFEVCRALKANYPIEFILGHEEIAPRRKTDPGPAFPLGKLREQILVGRAESDDLIQPPLEGAGVRDQSDSLNVAQVTATRLNFRQQPYRGAPMAGEPLLLGERVELIDKSGDWRKIRVYTEGWVHGDYLSVSE